MHLPKTAGVTVNNLLSRNYPEDEQFWFAHSGWEGFSDSEKIKYIHGHFDAVTASNLAQSRKLISFVRDPIARTLSEFYYWKAHTTWFIESENLVLTRLVKDMKLKEFLLSDVPRLRRKNTNFMTKAFAGFENLHGRENVDDEIFQLAVDNIAKFDYIGLVETMPDSIARILALLGIDDVYTGQIDNSLKSLPDNKYYEPVERELVTTELCALLLEKHAYDIRLYKVIQEKFS